MAVVNSAAEAKKMIASERHAEAALLTRVNTAVEKRPGDQAGMFKRGVRGWVSSTIQLQDKLATLDVRVTEYEPITAADLKATRTKDWESARKKVFKAKGGRGGEAGGSGIIPYLNFASKQLTSIPLELTNMLPVECLHMGYNQLFTINPNFFRLPVLTELNMDQNELKEIPAAFAFLTNLKILSLKNNKLERISYQFCGIESLEELALSCNFLEALPKFWGKLHNLKYLWLSNNKLRELPVDEMAKLLDYDPKTGERIISFSKGIGGLTSLEELWIDGNDIQDIPKDIGELSSLRYINLRGNSIRTFPDEIKDLVSLQHLVATKNEISSLPKALCLLPKLHTLNLAGNRIEEFPKYVVDATALTSLDLSNNPLKEVPSLIALLPKLVDFRTNNSGYSSSGAAITSCWSRTHHDSSLFPAVNVEDRGSRISIAPPENRPSTSASRLYPFEPRADPLADWQSSARTSGTADSESMRNRRTNLRGTVTRTAEPFRAVEVFDGMPDTRPSTFMTPGGRMPSSLRAQYVPPPTSIRAPATPFSSARPATRGYSSGAHGGS
ncbi:hypothetical protein T484DRAFT_3586035 [Baffinella frigidus]|nr:hypothetical protein T484DRAFT_3586035 [Cryptophyta sp. CCMP2293]